MPDLCLQVGLNADGVSTPPVHGSGLLHERSP